MKTIACIYCEGNDTKLAVVSQDKNGNRLKIISTASVDVVSNKSNLQPTAGFNLEGDGLQLEGVDSKDSSCLLYTSTSPRDRTRSRMPSSA